MTRKRRVDDVERQITIQLNREQTAALAVVMGNLLFEFLLVARYVPKATFP